MNLVRSALLFASQNRWMRVRAQQYDFVRRSVTRFMPGEHFGDALNAARNLAAQNIGALVTQLGENITSPAEAEQVRDHYLSVLEQIGASSLPIEISVKLTQLGLDLGDELCFDNLLALIDRAAMNPGA